MRFMLLFTGQGKLRLQKWYTATAERDKKKMVRELMQVVLARKPKMCSFLEWRDLKIVYKRYTHSHTHTHSHSDTHTHTHTHTHTTCGFVTLKSVAQGQDQSRSTLLASATDTAVSGPFTRSIPFRNLHCCHRIGGYFLGGVQ